MKYTQGSLGRIFVLRLEHGDKIPNVIEDFAKDKNINSALVHFLGGADSTSKVVVGPEDGASNRPVPMIESLLDVSEAIGIGTLFTNEDNIPKLHMHSAFGRGRNTITGCTREGIDIWHIGEVVIFELLDTSAKRKINKDNGFELLEV